MGEDLKDKFSAEIELISSEGGVFEVVVDGINIFSKKKFNRFPEDGEIATIIRK